MTAASVVRFGIAEGVATVTLFDGDEKAYGPMGLAAT